MFESAEVGTRVVTSSFRSSSTVDVWSASTLPGPFQPSIVAIIDDVRFDYKSVQVFAVDSIYTDNIVWAMPTPLNGACVGDVTCFPSNISSTRFPSINY